MKNLKNTFAIGFIAATLVACGSNNNAANLAAQQAAAAAAAQTAATSYANGCAPLQAGNFTFSASGVNVNPNAYLMAGTLNAYSGSPGVYGQVAMGTAAFNAATGSVIQYTPHQSQNGSFQLTVSGQSIEGSITLSPAIVQQLVYSTSYSGYGYNNTNTAAVATCVSSVAIQAALTANYNSGYTAATGVVNAVNVYLTLSTGQVVGPLAL